MRKTWSEVLPLHLRGAFPIACALALIAGLYWPVRQAGFVWTDSFFFSDAGWPRTGESWAALALHGFFDWTSYFRPLVVALFVAEQHAFAGAPGAAHLVSLGLHLANTALVGLLAARLLARTDDRLPLSRSRMAIAAMLLYGIHPALVEPVAWISCQFELVVAFFCLLGLLCNLRIEHRHWRALCVGLCFFLAAGAKESAVAFPFLLVTIDWIDSRAPAPAARLGALHELLQRQWPTYLCVFMAGVAYIALRHWAMGSVLGTGTAEPLFSLQRLQMVCWLLATYWRVMVWPMQGLAPLHEIDRHRFDAPDAAAVALDIGVLVAIATAFFLLRRRHAAGGLLVAASTALLPVLHVIPVDFDSSLYHERYAMTAIAIACAMLPLALRDMAASAGRSLRAATVAGLTVVTAWLAMAAMNVHATVPLWSNETKLWTWVVLQQPESILAKNYLLGAYLEHDDRARAWPIAEQLLAQRKHCPACLVNVANLALRDHRLDIARTALQKAQPYVRSFGQKRLIQAYTLALGDLHELENDSAGAEAAFRSAIEFQPLDPQPHMKLAMVLARRQDTARAHAEARQAFVLYAPDERETREREFNQVLAAALSASMPAAPK